MNKRYQRMACQALVILLAGCASVNPFAEKTQDYQDARLGKPLEVPPDLTRPAGDNPYTVPAAPAAPASAAAAVPQPPALAQPIAAPAAPAPTATASAVPPVAATAPAVAPAIVTAHAVLTKTSDGAAMLLMNEQPMEQAWRRVGMALETTHATIEDRNWSQGIYYVHSAPIKRPFWRFWQHHDPAAEQLWRVRLAPHGNFIGVTVLDDQGRPSDSPTANRLITALYQKLK